MTHDFYGRNNPLGLKTRGKLIPLLSSLDRGNVGRRVSKQQPQSNHCNRGFH